MHDRIKNGANLLEDHVFQFDFLNDDFSKLPNGLKKIINSPKERKKLIIYINPPYAEAGDSKQRTGTGENKGKTTTANVIYNKYKNKKNNSYNVEIGKATNELFAQFLIRIYCEIPTAKIANFSTLKNLQSSNFSNFRQEFQASLEKIFLVPADTFDNVKGQFPIGFFIWNTEKKERFECIKADVFDKDDNYHAEKVIYCYDSTPGFINKWIVKYKNKKTEKSTGLLITDVGDFQNQNQVFISNNPNSTKGHKIKITIILDNIIPVCIYFAVRRVIPADWLNDRDQFLYPNAGWENDVEFQNDCLIYTLFNNNISSGNGVNHWIPFAETDVNSRDKFDSHFMVSFLSGKIIKNAYTDLFWQLEEENQKDSKTGWKEGQKCEFSPEAQAVFEAGKELWKYYHAQPKCNVNASLYDIREYFQRRNEKGKMNSISADEKYNGLITALRNTVKILAKKIEPKVYEYGFLKG
jgi:hypothetical protein